MAAGQRGSLRGVLGMTRNDCTPGAITRPPTPSNTMRQLHSTLQHKHHTHVHFLGAGPVISINK